MADTQPPSLIATKGFPPILKRDLLFFDAVALPYALEAFSGFSATKRAELEWLANENAIILQDQSAVMEYFALRDNRLADFCGMWAWVMGLVRMLEDQGASSVIRELDALRIREVGRDSFVSVLPRVNAIFLGETRATRVVPLLDELPELNAEAIRRTVHQVRRVLRRHELEVRAVVEGFDNEFPLKLLFKFLEMFESDHVEVHSPILSKGNPAVEVVLDALPLPDESVSWEQVFEFRNNEESRASLSRLRKWMRGFAHPDAQPHEIREELDHLMNEYRAFMRLHKMKVAPGAIRTLLTVPADIAESVVAKKWGEAVRKLFWVRSREIALLEAESNAPGREVAYVVQSNTKFSKD